jgi:cellulose synthase/poly-beta-1,6-N-acetylglucosamine synthase-like glycosyltransferase
MYIPAAPAPAAWRSARAAALSPRTYPVLWIALGALALLTLTWVGYPLLLARAARRYTPAPPLTDAPPPVCVVIATREAPEIIARRVDDVYAGDYPRERLSVVVSIDARAAHPLADYERTLGDRARVVRGDLPGGKAAGLNAGVRAADAELVVLADSQQTFNREAISLIVRAMQNPAYAAVSGAVAQRSGDGLMDLYWRYEQLIREGQSEIHSVVSSTGQLCGVRRSLWPELPAELICDDLYMTMALVLRGYRVGYCPEATARDDRQFTREQHFQRKVRTLTGLVQVIRWLPATVVPGRNPIWLHFACHKLIRLITPYLAGLVALGVAVELWRWLGAMFGWALLALVVAAGAALVVRPRLATQLAWALRLQTVPLIAVSNGIRNNWQVWHAHRVERPDAAPAAPLDHPEPREARG